MNIKLPITVHHQLTAYLRHTKQTFTTKMETATFISELANNYFEDTTNHYDYTILKNYRKALYTNHSAINVTDFGAGSRVFTSNTRKISRIAKHAGISQKYARLLYRLTKHLQCQTILELGTSLGLGTSAFSLGNPNAHIITIEGCPETAKLAQQQFRTFQLHNIDLKINTFSAELALLQHQTFDCIYIDGNHQKSATLNYFNTLLNYTHRNSILIFDDIHWSKEMTSAWNIIKQHPKVTTTIDTFFWGFVFFRPTTIPKHLYLKL